MYLLNSNFKKDNLVNTIDTIIDEHTTNLRLEEYISYDAAIIKLLDIFQVDIKDIVNIDVFNSMLANEYSVNIYNNYQKFFTFIVNSMTIINNVNNYRIEIEKQNKLILTHDSNIRKLKSNSMLSNADKYTLRQYQEHNESLRNQINVLVTENETSNSFINSCVDLLDRLRVSLNELNMKKESMSKIISIAKSNINVAEETYTLLVNNNVIVAGITYNTKQTINAMYEDYKKLLDERNGYSEEIAKKVKEKDLTSKRLNSVKELLAKNEGKMQKCSNIIKENNQKTKEINDAINANNVNMDSIRGLLVTVNKIYADKLALEVKENEGLLAHFNLFKKYNLYDSELYNTRDLFTEISTKFELVDKLSVNFGFKDYAIKRKIQSYNIVDIDSGSIRYIDYNSTIKDYYFNYKFMNIFGQIKENLQEYNNIVKEISGSILSDNYNIGDVVECIRDMAYCLYNIYFSKDCNYSMYSLGIFSSDVNYNIAVINKSDEILNNVINFSKRVIIKVVNQLKDNYPNISNDGLSTLFSEVTNRLKIR